MGVLDDTLKLLGDARQKSDSAVVMYSGGKDSLVTLDLAMRTFKHVECAYMYVVPGLRCVETMLDYARNRWGVTIRQYPHWSMGRVVKHGYYCFNHWTTEDCPEMGVSDIYALAMKDTGYPLVLTGAKKADSQWRKRNLAATAHYEYLVHPMLTWTKAEVVAYLAAKKIPLPSSSGRAATGISLCEPSILWLKESWPDDYEKILDVFPLAEAIVKRVEFYGVNAGTGTTL